MKSKTWQKKRYYERVELAYSILGRKCFRCDSKEFLHFDHIDPSQKSAKITSITELSLARFISEVKKCQVLCQSCHIEKTFNEDLRPSQARHGTTWMYSRYRCRCEECRMAKKLTRN